MTIRKIFMVPAEEGTLASRCSNQRGFPVWPVASKLGHLWHCGIGNYGDDLMIVTIPKQCHCRWYPNCSWGAVLFQKPRELAWKSLTCLCLPDQELLKYEKQIHLSSSLTVVLSCRPMTRLKSSSVLSILPRPSKKQCEAVTAQLSLIWKTHLKNWT